MVRKNILIRIGEVIEQYQQERSEDSQNGSNLRLKRIFRWFVPSGGTLLIALLLIITQSVWARGTLATTGTSTNTISYQGRLADTSGTPITALQNMEFRLYDVPTGGVSLWDEFWTGGNAVQVSDGLFNVMLGSLNTNLANVVQGNDPLYLGITVGTDSEMSPRVQLGSVPFSMQALTVPDGSVTTAKIADGAVTQVKLGPDIDITPPFEGFSYYTYSFSKPAGWTTIIANIVDFNTFGAGTYNTSTGVFTAPKAGYYKFMSYGFISTAATGDVRIALGIGSAVSGGQFSAGDTPGPFLSHVMYLQAGGTVSISAYTPIGATFGGSYPWWFQGEYLGK